MKKIFWISVTSFFLLSGCNQNNEVAQNEKQNLIHVKNTNIQGVDRKTGQEIAQHLVKLTASMPNVRDATAVVIGNFAFVGIDVKENIDRSQVGSIKYSVAESLKDDPYGANAVVIADPDMTARLKEIQEDINNGEPIRGIMNELADISGRLMPEIPADIINGKPKSGIEDPKKQMNNKDEKNLDDKQQKQSNHHLD